MLRFGTDGVRGDADTDLTTPPDRRARSGRGAGARHRRVLHRARHAGVGPPHRGRPGARARGRRCERRLARRRCPTPAVAFLAQRAGAPAAIISASHNPWPDNGVKLVGRRRPQARRRHRSRDRSRAANALARRNRAARRRRRGSTPQLADRTRRVSSRISSARSTGGALDGLRVVVDCAQRCRVRASGRARCAPRAPRSWCCTPRPTVATSTTVAVRPTPRSSARAVRRPRGRSRPRARRRRRPGDRGRRTGRARRRRPDHGDAPRSTSHERGMLRNDAIAVTVMSNLGLRRALARRRHRRSSRRPSATATCSPRSTQHDLVLGGEQSGHVDLPRSRDDGRRRAHRFARARPRAPVGPAPVGARRDDGARSRRCS